MKITKKSKLAGTAVKILIFIYFFMPEGFWLVGGLGLPIEPICSSLPLFVALTNGLSCYTTAAAVPAK